MDSWEGGRGWGPAGGYGQHGCTHPPCHAMPAGLHSQASPPTCHPPTPHPHHLLPPDTTLEGHGPCLPRGRASSPPGPNSPPPSHATSLLGSHASCCPLAHVGVWVCVVMALGLIPLGRVVQQACMPRDGCHLTLLAPASHLQLRQAPQPPAQAPTAPANPTSTTCSPGSLTRHVERGWTGLGGWVGRGLLAG